jgi:hypothetical protein
VSKRRFFFLLFFLSSDFVFVTPLLKIEKKIETKKKRGHVGQKRKEKQKEVKTKKSNWPSGTKKERGGTTIRIRPKIGKDGTKKGRNRYRVSGSQDDKTQSSPSGKCKRSSLSLCFFHFPSERITLITQSKQNKTSREFYFIFHPLHSHLL